MDDKKIRSAVGNVTCGIFMGLGVFTMGAGVLLLVASLIESTRVFPANALYICGAGLSAYAVGAVIWNLTEITVNSRMILRELQSSSRKNVAPAEDTPSAPQPQQAVPVKSAVSDQHVRPMSGSAEPARHPHGSISGNRSL